MVEHTEERIFNHLLRQSDPGIEYQDEEDEAREEGSESDSEDEEVEENGETVNGEDCNGKNMVTEGDVAEDPRAGGVNVTIPQLCVCYSRIAEDLFNLGSNDGVRKNNRDVLYRISKKFKDVAL